MLLSKLYFAGSSNKFEKLEDRLDRMGDALKMIESQLIENGQQNIDKNTFGRFRQKIDGLASTVNHLREKIHFLEIRDQAVYQRLSRVQPDIEALKNEIKSLKFALDSSAHPYTNNTNPDVRAHGALKQLMVSFYNKVVQEGR